MNRQYPRKIYFLFLSIFFTISISAQVDDSFTEDLIERNKCGLFDEQNDITQDIFAKYWDYSYDSLLADLKLWQASSYVKIDSIGLSVQQRPLWRLTISEDPNNAAGKRTVHIHARTHPQETEGFWVTDEIIKILLSETELAKTIRRNCVFYIIPMYNPDGVQLEYPRRNANNIDIESNWNTFPHQPEVAALKANFIKLMNSTDPIEVMLNMHSSSDCERYFVYHHENGTSASFAIKEQNYINSVRSYFIDGIEPYTNFVSWANGTALQYPESWFWVNHKENVMAITYEDMYQCAGTGKFDVTANAILRGTMDYLGIVTNVEQIAETTPAKFELLQNYPNPFNPVTKIRYSIPTSPQSSPSQGEEVGVVTLKVYDILGKQVTTLVNEQKHAGNYEVEFSAAQLASGVYIYRLQANDFVNSKKMLLLK